MKPRVQQAPRELVVLTDDDGTPTGTAAKATVHSAHTPLHLAVSCYIFDQDGRLLVTRRALDKKTWPGVWTNSFCGHPFPAERSIDAVRRRGVEELGLEVSRIREVLPDFRYRAVDASGIVEHEICPVYCASADRDPVPDPDEVAEWRWVQPRDFATAVRATPWAFSPWVALQLPLMREII